LFLENSRFYDRTSRNCTLPACATTPNGASTF